MNIKTITTLALISFSSWACKTSGQKSLYSPQGFGQNTETEQQIQLSNAFSFQLLAEALKETDDTTNVLISPASVAIALGMTANGAKGETKNAILNTLRFDKKDGDFANEYLCGMRSALLAADSSVEIKIANSIWHDTRQTVKKEFVSQIKNYYDAEINSLDFRNKSTAGKVNKWVSQATNDKIEKIIDEIPEDLSMMLINAIYFKGFWTAPFDKRDTRKEPFFGSKASPLRDFMFIEKSFPSFTGRDFEMVSLPYGNEAFSMVAVLPGQQQSPEKLVRQFAEGGDLQGVLDQMRPKMCRLWFPKFRYSYENILNNELTTLGMGLPLSRQADFSGISSDQKLYISEVKHKAFIDVNEEGTEAAAVTSVGVSVTSLPQYHEISFNRPFLFFIRDNKSGLILFSGLVNDPAQK